MLPFVLKLWIESVFVDFVESVHWASGKYRHTELLDVKRNLHYYFINFAKLNYKYLNTYIFVCFLEIKINVFII